MNIEFQTHIGPDHKQWTKFELKTLRKMFPFKDKNIVATIMRCTVEDISHIEIIFKNENDNIIK